ncbi:MAG: hypothetical protein LBE09_09250, partial [Christensenellaceae bacterium]|nr:hypothetical protein [Christensenellaceae bacterium]
TISNKGFSNINRVNAFHSIIKLRNKIARGFATKYLNRYNALFERLYKMNSDLANEIYNELCDGEHLYFSVKAVKTHELLQI